MVQIVRYGALKDSILEGRMRRHAVEKDLGFGQTETSFRSVLVKKFDFTSH